MSSELVGLTLGVSTKVRIPYDMHCVGLGAEHVILVNQNIERSLETWLA